MVQTDKFMQILDGREKTWRNEHVGSIPYPLYERPAQKILGSTQYHCSFDNYIGI
jgi:hypothetical protein